MSIGEPRVRPSNQEAGPGVGPACPAVSSREASVSVWDQLNFLEVGPTPPQPGVQQVLPLECFSLRVLPLHNTGSIRTMRLYVTLLASRRPTHHEFLLESVLGRRSVRVGHDGSLLQRLQHRVRSVSLRQLFRLSDTCKESRCIRFACHKQEETNTKAKTNICRSKIAAKREALEG